MTPRLDTWMIGKHPGPRMAQLTGLGPDGEKYAAPCSLESPMKLVFRVWEKAAETAHR